MRSCFLVFVIIIFVLLLPVYFFIINFGETFTPQFIKREIASSGALEKISSELPAQLSGLISPDGSIDKNALSGALGAISSQDLKQTLQSNIENNLTALADQNSKELVFDIKPITSQLPSEMLEMAKQSGKQIEDRYVYPIPLQIRFYRYLVNNLAIFKLAGICFIGVFLGLIFLLADSWRTKLRAVSLSLLIPGLFIFIPSLLLRFLPMKLPAIGQVPVAITNIANDLLAAIKIDLATLFIWQGAVLVGCALAFFIFSFFVSGAVVQTAHSSQAVQSPLKKQPSSS